MFETDGDDSCKRCASYNNPYVLCSECVSDIFTDFFGLLDSVYENNDGDTLWVNTETTAHEALIDLAEKYDPGIAQELQARLEKEDDFTAGA